jgi:hypothetical protein
MFIVVLLLLFFLNYSPILASDRNIFGLHLTQPQDITSAKSIINSSGGDWGWATITIRTDQLDKNTWQEYFDNCRKYHVIPIIRLATTITNDYWQKPNLSDIDNLANFLNSLNWPTSNQYIIPFNEINHSTEWGGAVDIKDFTDIAIYTSQKFKSLNPNFFILSSPLDLAAPEKPPQFKSAPNVYREIYLYKPEYFNSFDGLASHSYPNHGYVGKPTNTGQHSILGYQGELNYLKSLGINNTYPIFITETGWPHREGEVIDNKYFTTTTTASFLNQALNIWFKDTRIKAVTPFIYNYPYTPFDHFSWLNVAQNYYPEYQKIIDSPKTKNTPPQSTKFELIGNYLPLLLFIDHNYIGQLVLKNTGQSIWGETKFCLNPQTTPNVTLDSICTGDELTYPNQTKVFNYKMNIHNLADYKDKTFISWQDLPQLEITAVDGNGTIYSPKTTIKQKIVQLFQSFFI